MDSFDSSNEEMNSEYEESVKRKSRRKSANSKSGAAPRLRHKSGSASYADLITNAIVSNKEARLSLAEIYDWMSTNVPSLQTQRYLHSSKGWKNAVRHTLSINPRFQKVTRIGRPSWWTLEETDALLDILEQKEIEILPIAHSWTSNFSLNDADKELKFDKKELHLESFRARCGSEPAYFLSSSKWNLNAKAEPSDCPTVNSKDLKYQKVKVRKEDGTYEFVNILTPILLKTTVCNESGTQTDDIDIQVPLPVPSPMPFDQTDPSKYREWDDTCESFPCTLTPSASSERSYHWLATIADDWRETALDQSVTKCDNVFSTDWFENV